MSLKPKWALCFFACWVCCYAWGQSKGEQLFAQHCSSCHQVDGSGTVGLAPALKGDAWLALGQDATYLLTVITKGMAGRVVVNGQTFVGSMPAFAGQLDDDAIAHIAQHVNQLQGGDAKRIYDAAMVTQIRQTTGSPPQTLQMRQKLLGAR